jgi:hypothetical protein
MYWPIPDWLPSVLWLVSGWLFWIGGAVLCMALALSLAQPRQRRLAKLLWPAGVLCLWTGICSFFGWAVLTDLDNVPYHMGLERLGTPLILLILGGTIGGYWLRAGIRDFRAEEPKAEVAA